jgi:H+-translocating NAD(P) transhydrogenase subunit alpha
MKVAIPVESTPGERRVATMPDVVPLLTRAGLHVTVQTGAGTASLAPDSAYIEAGAEVVTAVEAADVDVLLHVRPLHPKVIARLRPGAITIGFCGPTLELESVKALRDGRITAFAMELVPRISRAQSMDALTSQALVAGYRSVLEAAMRLPRFLPLFMTAAGTVPPARTLVLGAGVAGLQAIATAKRLGSVVSAYDVRSASADEVRSMGATFVDLGLDAIDGAGGYAREQSEDRAAQQLAALAPHVAGTDLLITTAAIPGRQAPLLVTRAMVEQMRPGSVVVDLAAESGGNVEGSLPGLDIDVPVPGGVVTVYGMRDAASTMPADASRLYAKNVANLLLLMTKDGVVSVDFADEVVAGTCLTYEGQVRHEATHNLLTALDPPPPVPAADSTTIFGEAAH